MYHRLAKVLLLLHPGFILHRSNFLSFEIETKVSWVAFDGSFKVGLPLKLVSFVPWPFITG